MPSGASPETEKRRKFIHQSLDANGEVAFKEIQEVFPGVERKSLQLDVSAMRQAGVPATIVGGLKERRIVLENRRLYTIKAKRSEYQTAEKKKIAEICAGLIFGLNNSVSPKALNEDGVRHEDEEVNFEITRDAVEDALDDCWEAMPGDPESNRAIVRNVREKLSAYWGAPEKSLVLDSGSSTDHVAKKIKHFDFGLVDGFDQLTLFTNSRSVFWEVGAPECDITTIVFGGKQRYQTESICGDLCRRCIEAWDLDFGMAVVGATGIDTSSLALGSYNNEEAAIKRQIFSRSKFRVVIADSTKFSKHPFQIAARFAKLNPSSIDLIITDSEPDVSNIEPVAENGRAKSDGRKVGEITCLQNCFSVPVLVADKMLKLR